MDSKRLRVSTILLVILLIPSWRRVQAQSGERSTAEEVALLRQQVAILRTQLSQLRAEFTELKRLPASATPPAEHTWAGSSAAAESAPQAAAVEELNKKVDAALHNLGGLRFSGDFRYRFDVQARSGNPIAGPLQNLRNRYRLRLNVDKDLDPRFRFHMQLSTGPLNNGITNDQDFAGTIVKHPFSIAEAYMDFHPHANFSLRGGRMEEVFADNMRFLWDDDVRFNGLQQIARVPVESGALGIKRVEFRAGEYVLSNPNVVIVAPGSPFLAAGWEAGQKVRAAKLYHPGLLIQGDLGTKWGQQFTSDVQIYRNPNQIQLASTAAGFPVLVNPTLGLALAGPVSGTGNATTAPGGAIYHAPDFQIVRLAWRLERKGVMLRGREVLAWFDLQVSRNAGAGRLRDALMASANLGAVRQIGDVRFLYQFAIKDANALISQFTDDDLGTGAGVNIAVHALRFDLGLTRSLQWQNLLFIQNQRRASNPAEQFFVPLQRGANTTFRYQGQLAFSF